MINDKNKNVKIFQENDSLFSSGAYRDAGVKTISYKNSPNRTGTNSKNFNIRVLNCGSFEPINEYENCCVLNFASAINPGGGYVRGAIAQEEALCRQSDLYEELKNQIYFYEFHRKNNSELHSDWMLYSKNITVFRDEYFNFVNPKTCSVITAAAPRNVPGKTNKKDIEECFYRRIEKILTICEHHNHKNIILGAWGCGVFRNDPAFVSRCFNEVLSSGWSFDNVVFSVYDVSTEKTNFLTFQREFS